MSLGDSSSNSVPAVDDQQQEVKQVASPESSKTEESRPNLIGKLRESYGKLVTRYKSTFPLAVSIKKIIARAENRPVTRHLLVLTTSIVGKVTTYVMQNGGTGDEKGTLFTSFAELFEGLESAASTTLEFLPGSLVTRAEKLAKSAQSAQSAQSAKSPDIYDFIACFCSLTEWRNGRKFKGLDVMDLVYYDYLADLLPVVSSKQAFYLWGDFLRNSAAHNQLVIKGPCIVAYNIPKSGESINWLLECEIYPFRDRLCEFIKAFASMGSKGSLPYWFLNRKENDPTPACQPV